MVPPNNGAKLKVGRPPAFRSPFFQAFVGLNVLRPQKCTSEQTDAYRWLIRPKSIATGDFVASNQDVAWLAEELH